MKKHFYSPFSKHITNCYLILSLVFASFLQANAQTTETFEALIDGSSSFTAGSRTFNLTPSASFKIASLANYGYLSSNKFIDNATASNGGNPVSITSTNSFTVKSLYLYPSTDGGSTNQTSGVSVTFTGKLNGTTVFTYTPPAADFTAASWNNATNRGFSLVNFTTPGYENIVIDELVTDIGGAGNYIAIDNFTFTAAAACPTVTPSLVSQTNIACNGGSNGSAKVSATGGTSFTYSWAPIGGTSATASSLSAGTYTCTITNECGNKATQTVTITQPTVLSLTAKSQTNIACNGGFNGAASVNAAIGGVGPYTYNWTPGNPTGDGTTSVTGLTAGTWTCTVTDANTCLSTQTFTITQPTVLSLTAKSQTNIACNGGVNGAASVNAATGGAGGYIYNWTPGNPTGDGTTSVTGLTAGTWTCTVTDANTCVSTQTFTITQPTVLSLTAKSQTNIACNGGFNGAASVNAATGGAGGYIYNWTPGNPTGDGTTSVTGLTAGTWTCTVTDANTCVSTQTFTITQPTVLSLTPNSQTNIACNGGSNGAASVNAATGGAGGYTYNWTPGNPTGDGTTSVTGLTAGTWTCTVTDANACESMQTFSITQPTAMLLTPNTQKNVSCNGGSNGAASVNAAVGGAGGYIYNWTPGNPTGDGTTSVTGLTAGTWTCTVTDANTCVSTQTFSITQPNALVVQAIASATTVCQGNAVTLTGQGAVSYTWDNNVTDGVSFVPNETITYTVTGYDQNQCSAIASVKVTVGVCTGIDESQKNHVVLFPNPAQNIVYFLNQVGKVVIIDATGKVVKSEKDTSFISVADLENGIYLIQFDDNMSKIQVQH